MTGMKLVASAEMDYRNSSIVGLAAAIGVGVSQASAALASLPDWVTTIFGKSPVVLATLIGGRSDGKGIFFIYGKNYLRYTNAGSPSSPRGTFTFPWISGRA